MEYAKILLGWSAVLDETPISFADYKALHLPEVESLGPLSLSPEDRDVGGMTERELLTGGRSRGRAGSIPAPSV